MPTRADGMVWVSWHDCSCDWLSKYCDEHHRKTALVPIEVLNEWRAEPRGD